MELTNREFIGKVLPDADRTHSGRYYVHIPELQTNRSETEGILVKNHVHNYRVTYSASGTYGSYFPLQPKTIVVVKFFINNLNSGYVERIISDADPQCLPFKIVDRDNYYQVIRTPKKDNLLAIYEGSTEANVPKNSIHFYFNDTRTVFVIDEEGITIRTEDNLRFKAKKNIEFFAEQEIKTYAKQNISNRSDQKILSEGITGIELKSPPYIYLEANMITSKAAADNIIEGGSGVHLKAAVIHQEGTFDVYSCCPCGKFPLCSGSSASANSVNEVPTFDIIPTLIKKIEYPYFSTG